MPFNFHLNYHKDDASTRMGWWVKHNGPNVNGIDQKQRRQLIYLLIPYYKKNAELKL